MPSTGIEQQEYKRRYDAFILKLNGKDDDIVAVCGPELQWLIPKAGELMPNCATRADLASTSRRAQGSGGQKQAKAQAAVNVTSASPVI